MSDIRSYFPKRPRLTEDNATPTPGPSSSTRQYPVPQANASHDNGSSNSLDIGLYLDENTQIGNDLRYKLLTKPWKPRNNKEYNFKNDVKPNAKAFIYKWLSMYTWLAYSAKAKGPFCRICVLFRPKEQHLPQPFINSPCLKYQNFHVLARSHEESERHREAQDSSNSFKDYVDREIRELKHKAAEEKRIKLRSIVSTILICAKHDLSLRARVDGVSLFADLLHFRIDSGDESGVVNLATSDRIHSLIESCSNVLKSEIIKEVNERSVFSMLVGETTDIDGKEQLSIGVRYLRYDDDVKNPIICEEFLGYVPIKELNPVSISETIIRFLRDCKFNLDKLVGQGYDGCATLAGYMDDVKDIIKDKYPTALLFHCASQVLNHVVNDMNDVSEVRHTARTTKDIIHFIKENTQHIYDLRSEVSDITLFYETNWTNKCENIRIFSTNFLTIVKGLEELSRRVPNPKTKTKAHQLYTITTNPTYIVTMSVIAEYSAKLESICKQLQEEYLNINAIHDHINQLTNILENHRDSAEEFDVIYEKVLEIYNELNVEFTQPRVEEQVYEANEFENVKDFFRRTIFIPYLNSIIAFLRNRFSSAHNMAFSLMQLHPKIMTKLDKSSFLRIAGDIQDFYGELLPNFIADATNWYDWSTTDAAIDTGLNESVKLADLVGFSAEFYTAVRKAIEIALTIPATTSYEPETNERTISTLRHAKRWNRSTMGHARENGLCMLSVHKKRVEGDAQFIDKVIKKHEQGIKSILYSNINSTLQT